MVSRVITHFHDNGSPNSGQNYGPISVGAGNKLTRVRFRGSIIYPPATITTSGAVQDPIVWGLQWGALGYTPASIENTASWSTPTWLKIEYHVPGQIGIAWAPSTDTCGFVSGGPVDLTWIGQLPLPAGADVYLSTGYAYSTTLAWEIYGTLEALYA